MVQSRSIFIPKMALLCSRFIGKNFRNPLAAASRFYSSEKDVPVSMELAVGHEKWELEQNLAQNNDPFKMQAIKRQASSKANPIMVSSYYDCRIVGCICEEDSSKIIWMWLFKGEPRRCYCGHWFKLSEYKPV